MVEMASFGRLALMGAVLRYTMEIQIDFRELL